MEWERILAYITGTVDQELLLRNEYVVAENRILKSQLKGRLKLSDVERTKLGEIGHRLGRKALGEVAATALPDTILAWYRRLIARKFDGSQARRAPGRPRIDGEVKQLIVRMADENRSWGYDRIVGALANLGHEISDQTVGNVLRRHGLPSAPARKHTTTWAAFIGARESSAEMRASSSFQTYCGFNPRVSDCRLHSTGASRSRSTPMPRGKRPSIAALTRSGARNASEMVILTCRTLHFWRVAICSTLVAEPETISSSQRRPRAIAVTRRARRSIRVGRTSFRGTPSGMRICRDFLDGGFCQGIDSN